MPHTETVFNVVNDFSYTFIRLTFKNCQHQLCYCFVFLVKKKDNRQGGKKTAVLHSLFNTSKNEFFKISNFLMAGANATPVLFKLLVYCRRPQRFLSKLFISNE